MTAAERETLSPSDPATIIAGIRQFGLAPDGSDLRELEAAIARAAASPASVTTKQIAATWNKRHDEFMVVRHGLGAENMPSHVEDWDGNMVFGPTADDSCFEWIEDRCAEAVLALIRGASVTEPDKDVVELVRELMVRDEASFHNARVNNFFEALERQGYKIVKVTRRVRPSFVYMTDEEIAKEQAIIRGER